MRCLLLRLNQESVLRNDWFSVLRCDGCWLPPNPTLRTTGAPPPRSELIRTDPAGSSRNGSVSLPPAFTPMLVSVRMPVPKYALCRACTPPCQLDCCAPREGRSSGLRNAGVFLPQFPLNVML